jgi:glycosyltransferase involved in cell wall biosynthesis
VNLCTSRAAMNVLGGHGVQRLSLWPYGVDPALMALTPPSDEWRRRLSGGRPERPILLFVGRLAKEKSIDRLVPLARSMEGIALAIVGDGPCRARLEREFAGTPTTFLGLVTGVDLVNAYASADVFVFPSQSETLGLVLLEAHAAGLPVIAADSSAARELVRDGVDGLRYDPDDPRSLIEAVEVVLGNAPLRRRMQAEARRAVAGATWAEATAVLRNYYAAIASVTERQVQSPSAA